MKSDVTISTKAECDTDTITVPANLTEFVDAAYGLSTMAAAINWDGRGNRRAWLASLREKIETVQAMVRGIGSLEPKFRLSTASGWKDIVSAPHNKHVIVISARFPEPHEAMLYDNGWFTWGANGSYSDDPYLWTELPAAPDREESDAAKIQPVIVVWDRNGKFFQNWTAEFRNGDGIAHGKEIARSLGGTYVIVGGSSTATTSEEIELPS
jgi:hypothetical protein